MRATSRLISTDNHDGEAERLEELAGNAGHQRDRQEHRDDRHGRCKHREADFVGSVERGLIGGFAHAHVAHDILDLDDGIVDQDAGDQAHRHAVDMKFSVIPIKSMNQKAGIADSGMASAEIERRADVAEEQQDHEHGEDRAFDQAFHRRGILRLGIVDLVEDLGMNLTLGFSVLDLAQLFPRLVVGGDFGRALGALDLEADDLPAVLLGQRALLGIAVLDLAEVGQPDLAAARQRNLRLRQAVGVFGIAEHAHRLFGSGNFGAAAARR